MRFLGDNPFHSFLLLTARPASWPWWLVAPVPLGLAALAGWTWAQAGHDAAWGWASAALLLVLALADGGLLVALPRTGTSYGPVQPPFLALSLLRGLLALLAAVPAAGRPDWLPGAWTVQAAVQALIYGLALQGTLWEPFRLQVTRLGLAVVPTDNPGQGQHLARAVVTGAPAPRFQAGPPRGLRIVQVSDLHVERLTRRERALPGLLDRLAPDLLVLTGDFLSTTYNDEPRALDDLDALLRRLPARHRFAIWGTEEVDLAHVLRPVLHEAGVTILEDRGVEAWAGGQHLWIVGVSCSRDLAADGARLRGLLAQAPPGALTLLLYHTPDLMPLAAELNVDLYLAGHTHGGQWRLPGFGAILTASHYGKRYESGHYHQGRTHLYVSRGLGMEGFGTPRARFFCPPEVVVVDLEPAPAPAHGPAGRGEG